MDNDSRILITGGAGFIGSCMAGFLNRKGFNQLILADNFFPENKEKNLQGKQFSHKINREDLFHWLPSSGENIRFVFHLGARTDTTEYDYAIHERLNLEYSKQLWNWCVQENVPLVYASSAATYGAGELGYSDDHRFIPQLRPLNEYAVSKNEFDKWVLQQTATPPFWAGLKFFNVYGPNEYHKSRMASMIWHAYRQIQQHGEVRLFRSYHPDYKDGQQLRDFIYVKDILQVGYWLMHHQQASGNIYNLGTGKARTFEDLVKATFSGAGHPQQIRYIDIDGELRHKYQYFTEADMKKLREAGYTDRFFTLEEGVEDYVKNYLSQERYY
ncbi:ADP-glyceromanno-heptose 6-epimerase [Chitinophaga sp. Mgbs1]|uniref:ADP-L-glycero-D-manno-heptose-6-epimerase n=1 Tax=Chitinophaga solisilvae TaxID=1233460 RepID=A0A3S1B4L9_9BACT|nr:ADP-glyceromanno-heptose 6-epimerase [Chitinophaga solisilvae]